MRRLHLDRMEQRVEASWTHGNRPSGVERPSLHLADAVKLHRRHRRAEAEHPLLVVVEDSPGDAYLVRELLRRTSMPDVFEVGWAQRLCDAMPLLARAVCVILDLGLPDAVRLEGLKEVRRAAPDVPVVVLTGDADEELGLEALREGAQDYLLKGEVDGRQLTRAIRYAIERGRSEARLKFLAFHDVLTGLVNRTLFTDRLTHALERLVRTSSKVALLVVDLDHFKLINDSLGHAAGDRLLVAVGERLRATVRPCDTVGRLGGDEFAVLCEGVGTREEALGVSRRILDALGPAFAVAGQEVFAHASVGLVIVESSDVSAERLLADADIAMYVAKRNGRGRLEVFSEEVRSQLTGDHLTRTDLHHAVERGEMRLAYQPIVDLWSGHVVGVEALLRWAHPQRGQLSPAEFLGEAEETGLIIPIGAWVLATSLRDIRSWRTATGCTVGVAVNLSPTQLGDSGLIDLVVRSLDNTKIEASDLTVEITETVLLRNVDRAATDLHRLRSLGVHVAIDDFGVGYSSLDYLRRLPVDSLKIDRSFVSGLEGSEQNSAIVRSLIAMASALNLSIVAEGVETTEQLLALRRLGCTTAQGFLLAVPLPADAITELLGRPVPVALDRHRLDE